MLKTFSPTARIFFVTTLHKVVTCENFVQGWRKLSIYQKKISLDQRRKIERRTFRMTESFKSILNKSDVHTKANSYQQINHSRASFSS